MTYDIIKLQYCNRTAIDCFARNDFGTAVSLDAATVYAIDLMKKPAVLTIEDTIEDGVYIYTTTLAFRTCREITSEFYNKTFFATSAASRTYMIGGDGRPYPRVTQRLVRGSQQGSNNSQLLEITVEWKTDRPPLLVSLTGDSSADINNL